MVSSQSGIETTIEVELFNTLGWSHLVFGIDMMNLLAEGDSGCFLGFSGEGSIKGQLCCPYFFPYFSPHFFPYFSPQLFPYFSIYYSVQLAYII